jgi:hypothetical protein
MDSRIILPASMLLLYFIARRAYQWLWKRRLVQVWDVMGQPLGFQIREDSGLDSIPYLEGGYGGRAADVSTFTRNLKYGKRSYPYRFTDVALTLSRPEAGQLEIRRETQLDKAGKRFNITDSLVHETAFDDEFWINADPTMPVLSRLEKSREARDALRALPQDGTVVLEGGRLIYRQRGLLNDHRDLQRILQTLKAVADVVEED